MRLITQGSTGGVGATQELELSQRWLGGRRPGIDLPTLYLERNPPPGPLSDVRDPVANRPELTLASIRRYRHDGERDWLGCLLGVEWDPTTYPIRLTQRLGQIAQRDSRRARGNSGP